MNLDEAQRQKVVEWIGQGLKLAEIQNRLISELHITMTPAAGARSPGSGPGAAMPKAGQPAGAPGKVALSVDQITRPGAVVSGKVTFSDGTTAAWQLDQTGQLGLIAPQPGYRPPASDVQPFQMALEAELAKLGL